MTTYYLDSSALSKRYVEETGTAWLRGILAPAAGNAVITARITMVSCTAPWRAGCGKARLRCKHA